MFISLAGKLFWYIGITALSLAAIAAATMLGLFTYRKFHRTKRNDTATTARKQSFGQSDPMSTTPSDKPPPPYTSLVHKRDVPAASYRGLNAGTRYAQSESYAEIDPDTISDNIDLEVKDSEKEAEAEYAYVVPVEALGGQSSCSEPTYLTLTADA